MGVVPLLNPNWPWFVKKVEQRPLIPDSYAKRMVVSQIGSSWRHHARTTLLSDGESGIIPGERTSSGFHANQVIARIGGRSEEHTSELQSLMRISYAVFCLTKTTILNNRFFPLVSLQRTTIPYTTQSHSNNLFYLSLIKMII